VLVRVRDRVGNAGDPQAFPVTLATPEEIERQAETRVRVTGRVLYRGQPVAGAIVSLKAGEDNEFGPVETDEQGKYAIEDVPVGAYEVSARGVVNNTPRFPPAPLGLEVKPGDPRVKRLDIAIRPNRLPEDQ
jgi:hypothetical protein